MASDAGNVYIWWRHHGILIASFYGSCVCCPALQIKLGSHLLGQMYCLLRWIIIRRYVKTLLCVIIVLSHWGWMPVKSATIRSDYGLLPVRRQAIICTSGPSLSVWHTGINWNLCRKWLICIEENQFRVAVRQMTSSWARPQCVKFIKLPVWTCIFLLLAFTRVSQKRIWFCECTNKCQVLFC